jgi:hypothetical protein
LQNLHRILQSQLANVNPLHLQQALQRQQASVKTRVALNYYNLANKVIYNVVLLPQQHQQLIDAGRKQLESMLQQMHVSFLKFE